VNARRLVAALMSEYIGRTRTWRRVGTGSGTSSTTMCLRPFR